MAVTAKVPALAAKANAYCPGCGHGIVNRLMAEVLTEEGYQHRNIGSIGVGCSCNMNAHWAGEKMQCPHGRAAATVRGFKLAQPEVFAYSYQGDGDAYVIGLSETLNAAYVNAPVTLIVINNQNFAMTGGQMSWTTLPDEVTTTSVHGRKVNTSGAPIHIPEMMANGFDIGYAARGSVHSVKEIRMTKKYLREAVKAQMEDGSFSIIEVLSPCPTNWKMTPMQAIDHMEANVLPYYKTGEFKTREVKQS